MATIYQVAEKAGVSLSTVSRVLNGLKTVNPALREKVERAVKELNYSPSSVARSLATNRTDSVGILVSELHTPFFGEMMQAIETTLREQNKHAIISVGHNDREKEKEAIEFLLSRNCDALILHVEGMTDEDIVSLNNDRVKVAVINRNVERLKQACFCLDNENGGYKATEHLLKLGHTDIAYISGPLNKADAQLRFNGHKRALDEAGVTYSDALFFEGNFKEETGIAGLKHLMSQPEKFTALVCANDWMASGAMACARDMGLHLPDQLSIVGFDDVVIAHHVYPKLTSVCNPIYDMGAMAAKYILNEVYQQKHQLQHMYDANLVLRDSTMSK